MAATADNAVGVRFPETDGKVSTSAVGRGACTAAAAAVDSALAARTAAVADWRSGYVAPFRNLTAAAARSPQAAIDVSAAGLDYLRTQMEFASADAVMPVADVRPAKEPSLRTRLVAGEEPVDRELVVPVNGRRLSGNELLVALDEWVRQGIVEPGFRDAIALVVRNPDWLDLSDTAVAVLGAGAEMGPTVPLLRWGGRVIAVDLPSSGMWRRLIAAARTSGGSLEVPVPVDLTETLDDVALAQAAGVDIIRDVPAIWEMLAAVEGPLVLGNYLYADSGTHVLVSMAADILAAGLAEDRDDVTLAFLATPTDAYAVPWRDVETARERWHHRRTSLVQGPLHMFGAFQRNYTHTVVADSGVRFGISDALVPQQGPNYALAKRLQRWRAVVARSQGTPVSLNVAPSTRTRSVVKNGLLSAAYAGAHRFGIQVFDPSTSNTLMAALLVHDLRNLSSPAQPDVKLSNPMALFSAQANHGGLWTSAYDPRSVLGFAAALGMFEARA